jgi:hypothetical protein
MGDFMELKMFTPPMRHFLYQISQVGGVALGLVLSTGMSFAGTESPRTQVKLAESAAQRALAVSPNAAPFLTKPSDMTVTEGSEVEQFVSATDEDGQSLQFYKLEGPEFLSVATISPGTGSATGRIRLHPGFIDAGTSMGTVGVSDGIAGARQRFAVSVTNASRAPSSMWSPLSSSTIPTSYDPAITRVADLNGDGISDLVVGHINVGAISVFLGEGGAGFHLKTTFGTGLGVSSLILDDFTGDSRPDLVTCHSGSMRLLAGLGDGTFGPAVVVNAGPVPHAGDSGDLNGDGFADLVVCNYDAGTVSVLLADGLGHFSAPVAYTVGITPGNVELEDLNRDGNLDMAVAISGGSVSILFGNGAGSFTAARQYPAAQNPLRLAVGDLNGDRWPDIVTASSGYDSLGVMLGSGNGEFQSPTWFRPGNPGSAFAIRDFNADGRPDLALASVGGLWILPGNGAGGFERGFLTGAGVGGDLGVSAWSTAVDFNGDGAADLVLPDRAGSRVLVVLSKVTGGSELAARAFPSKPGPIQIGGSGSPYTCLSVEPVAGAYNNADVNLSSFVMTSVGTGEVDLVHAASTETSIIGDTDGNGVNEINVCFSREDLRRLLGGLSGIVTVPVGIEAVLNTGVPLKASLNLRVKSLGTRSASISPNPINPEGVLSFETAQPGAVRVRVYDLKGRLIRTVIDNQRFEAGVHSVRVDARDDAGNHLSSGVFFYQVESPERIENGRFAVVK